MGKRRQQIFRVVLALVVGLGLLEVVFRVRDHNAFPHLNIYQADKQLGLRLQPLAETRMVFGGSAVTRIATNSAGFRSAEPGQEPPPRDGEVLFVGDSQTFALGVAAEQSFVSRFGELGKRPVYNAGVPTWGPPEYAVIIDEVGKRRHPRAVVYVVNFANDAFEANHPNRERHVAWDGWAVRREYAPQHVRTFPGRELLFSSSHLVLAWRKFWHDFGGNKLDERGTPSEGTFRDLVDLGRYEGKAIAAAQRETERRAAQYEAETTYAEEAYRNAESRVKALVWAALKLGATAGADPNQSPGTVYLAADANPGDIVTPGYGEEGRPIYATAQYIRQAVGLRNKFEAEMRERARRALDSDDAKQILGALSARDAERIKVDLVRSKPLEVARYASPLLRAVLDAKRRSNAIGAEFVLLILPLDVMVSDAEWPKHGAKRVDLSAANVLTADLAESARQEGIATLDATDVLRQNEPGVFLPGDIHLTPKGHAVVAQALAQTFERGKITGSGSTVRMVLKPGRSRVPPAETWRALAGEVAVMNSGRCPVTKKYREWLYVKCYPKSDNAPKGVALQVVAGGQGDAITSVVDGRMTFVAPMPRAERLEALFTWSDGLTKRLIVDWDPKNMAADLHMEADRSQSARPNPHPEVVEILCSCHKSERKETDCHDLIAEADPDCTRTYAGNCVETLACAEGNPLYPPQCEAGEYNQGATSRCVKGTPPDNLPSSEPSLPDPTPVAAETPEVQAAGQKVVTNAQAFAGEKCTLGSDQVELISIIPFDRCPIDDTMVAAYKAALGEFEQLAKDARLTSTGKTFSERARWFGKWVSIALVSHDTRGAAALYQDLAFSFNAWQPKHSVYVDPPRMLNLYFGLSGVPQIDYFRNLRHDGSKRKAQFIASGQHLIWRRGPNGFEGPFLSLDERVVGGY